MNSRKRLTAVFASGMALASCKKEVIPPFTVTASYGDVIVRTSDAAVRACEVKIGIDRQVVSSWHPVLFSHVDTGKQLLQVILGTTEGADSIVAEATIQVAPGKAAEYLIPKF